MKGDVRGDFSGNEASDNGWIPEDDRGDEPEGDGEIEVLVLDGPPGPGIPGLGGPFFGGPGPGRRGRQVPAGFRIKGDIHGNFARNIAVGNPGAGAVIDGSVKGNVVGNVTSENGWAYWFPGFRHHRRGPGRRHDELDAYSGMLIRGGVYGDVSQNVANWNAGNGIRIDRMVGGNVDRNTTNGNGQGFMTFVYALEDEGGRHFGRGGPRHFVRVIKTAINLLSQSSGLVVGGPVYGNVDGNTAIGNLGGGINLYHGVWGSVIANNAHENGLDLFDVEDLDWFLSDLPLGDVEFRDAGHFLRDLEYGEGILLGGLGGGWGDEGGRRSGRKHGRHHDLLLKLGGATSGIFIYGPVGDKENPADIAFNNAHGNTFVGMTIVGPVSGSILANATHENGIAGLLAITHTCGDVTGNLAHGNGLLGITLLGHYGGDISRNRTFRNGISGLLVGGGVYGGVIGNEANGSLYGNGMTLLGHVDGPIARNTTNDNGLWGTMTLLHGENVLQSNVSRDNGREGLGIFLSDGSDVSLIDNSLSGNNDGGREVRAHLHGRKSTATVHLKDNTSRNTVAEDDANYFFTTRQERNTLNVDNQEGNIGTIGGRRATFLADER